MKIIYVGPLHKGGTCFQRMEAMKDLGHEITPVDTEPEDVEKKQNEFLYRVKRKLLGPSDLARVNKRILQLIGENTYKILWIDKGLTLKPETLRNAKQVSSEIAIVGYSPDDMLNPDNQSRKYLEGINLYDFHITTKSYNVSELKSLGAKEVYFIDNAFCNRTHRPVYVSSSDRRYLGGPVGFIGTYEKERADSIAYLANHGVEIKIWGDWPLLWAKKLGLDSVEVKGERLLCDDYTRAICSFDVNLNFLRKINRDLQTTRSIEIPACAGFMLAERTEEHLRLFKEAIEAEYFSSNEELLRKIMYYFSHDEERKLIAKRGYERCISGGYSNQDRLKKVFEFIRSKADCKK